MKLRIGIPVRMILLIVLSAMVIFNGTIKIISIYYKKTAYAEIIKNNANQADKITHHLQFSIDDYFSKLASLGASVKSSFIPEGTHSNYLSTILNDYAKQHNNIDEISYSLSLNKTMPEWNEESGRVKNRFVQTMYGIEQKSDTLDIYGDDEYSTYYKVISSGENYMSPIQWSNRVDENGKKHLNSQLTSPLKINDELVGNLNISMSLKPIKTFIDSITQASGNNKMVLSNTGIILFHPNKKYIGKEINIIDTLLSNQYNIINRVNEGEPFQLSFKNYKGQDSVYIISKPVLLEQTNTSWAVLSIIDLAEADASIMQSLDRSKRFGSFGMIILGLIILIFSRSMAVPIRKASQVLSQLGKGQVHNVDKLNVKSRDEVGNIGRSVNTLMDRLNNITVFSEEIGKGNFQSKFNLASKNDILGKSILDMRNSLEIAREEELNRIKQKEQLNWASEGINRFNRILRVDNQNIEKLTYDIIQNLTNYMGTHMGGIYLQSNQDEQAYELTNHIGFNKEKYTQVRVSINDGEIGRCILEKETIFMNDIPEDYTKIGSGLGFSKPSSILIVPLIHNDNLVGIIELESLKDIEKHQIEFVEKLSETIASTVASVKINVRTAELLSNSQKQAEELEQQEEEMRQNMEEMQATQEEAKKHEDELLSLIEGFNKSLLTAEYDIRERLTEINDNYLNLYKVSKSQIIGKQHKADLFMDETEQRKHKEFWAQLLKGESQESIEYIKSGKENHWISEQFIPIKDSYGSVSKVLCIGFDITEERNLESQLKQAREGGFKTKKSSENTDEQDGKPSIDFNMKIEVIDLTYLKMVYRKDSKKIFNILKLYNDTLPQQVKELGEIHDTGDFVKLKSKINGLKTKMNYLGLKKIYEHLRSIEKSINEDQNLSLIPDALDSIYKEWTLASKELERLLGI